MYQQIKTMLLLQEAMNSKVNPAWREQGYAWYRAVWVECAELMDHYGWKWWKKQSPDRDQVVLELIDIWHFGLSLYLLKCGNDDESLSGLAERIGQEFLLDPNRSDDTFRDDLEVFTEATLRTKDFSVSLFCRLLDGVKLDFDQLFNKYVGKNVLNLFRQDHGYKEGTYNKVWAGREDNEHLVEALVNLDSTRSDFADALYQELQKRYYSHNE
ncbi:dUTP diphosphatase [Teredinibacter turnerae]|uniref:dUTP diphosphatase n=1 Tax=Teredinibacter turnerae TaxID=2426 RepID=UPI0004064609|nr:dUTP diphosphatase [Teredinibacter turnerae]